MQHTLQELVLPTPELGLPEALYWQPKSSAIYHATRKRLELLPGGKIDFNSFFNALAVNQWNLHHNEDALHFTIKGEGQALLEIYSGSYSNDALLVSELVTLNDSSGVTVSLPAVIGDPHGAPKLLYSVISSSSGATLTSFFFSTTTPPRQKVRVGISITHYKREAWVLPAIERIRKELLSDSAISPLLHLFVVDNSQTLDFPPHQSITLVKNRNLGGAGGFARGLLECDLSGDFTHCLFLDDDATMELESVRRAVRAIQYAPADTALTGTLFRGDTRSCIYEVGATYKVFPQPLLMDLDMRRPESIDRFVQEHIAPHYGGWWFFLFPLAHVRHYPFPYFVRGDDIAFGVTNKFRVRPLLGVACWAEDFASKDSPFLRYLDLRAMARLPMIANTCTSKQLSQGLRRCIFDLLLTYRYDSAEAALLGSRDALRGTVFWRDNIDLTEIRAKFGSVFAQESFRPLRELEAATGRTFSGIQSPRGPFRQSMWRRFVRFVTINGYLLPRNLLSKQPAVLLKDICALPYLVYPHSEILYVRKQDGHVMLAQRDLRRALRLMIRTLWILALIRHRYSHWRKTANATYETLATKQFWSSIYHTDGKVDLARIKANS